VPASLHGKTAIVTGASSGIGAATARMLTAHGVKVAGGARRTERLETEFAYPLDVTDSLSCRRFVDAAVEALDGIDILVNNAGLALGREPVWESADEDDRVVIETNVLGLMRMTRLCLPHIRDWGHIVNLGSIAGIWSYKGGASYVAAKAAVHMYTRALRDDLQGRPIRITNLAPGLVSETEFSNVRFKGDDEKAAAVYRDVAVGGPLIAEDVVECIEFAVTRRPPANVDEIVLMALAQTSGGNILRE
jgi:3-hydroxy acid dehydrogenase / malonic semialdehyde reductase